jgi:activator of HSP90 ATPase
MNRIYAVVVFFTITILLHTRVNAQNNQPVMSDSISHADSVKGISIHQEISFAVAPHRVYQVLLSSEQFSASTKRLFEMFTASSANIDAREGGAFSLFDGHIIGRILELVPDKRIVEAWRVVDWPAGVYSIARFDLEPRGTGTSLMFDHIGFPEGLKEHLTTGWQQHYWDALNKYFQSR